MRFLRFKGDYTNLSAAALTAYYNGLVGTHGLTPVGLPVRRTFSGGVAAAAMFEEGMIALRANGIQIIITAHIGRSVDFEALKAFTVATFGLTGNYSITEDMEQ